jgi:hypothetical protein
MVNAMIKRLVRRFVFADLILIIFQRPARPEKQGPGRMVPHPALVNAEH